MFVQLWAEKHDQLESRESWKTWAWIAEKILKALRTNKTADKCMRKMKYIIEQCKIATIGTKTKQDEASASPSTTMRWIKSLDAAT